jgi:hypothetical protein
MFTDTDQGSLFTLYPPTNEEFNNTIGEWRERIEEQKKEVTTSKIIIREFGQCFEMGIEHKGAVTCWNYYIKRGWRKIKVDNL